MALFFTLISATCVLGQNVQSPAQQRAADRVVAADAANQRRFAIIQAQETAAEVADNARLQRVAAREAMLRNTMETYPWRTIGGVTQQVNGAWCAFSGTIQRAGAIAVTVNGEFHPIYPGQGSPFSGIFFVRHYPYQAATGDIVPNFMAAKPAGIITMRNGSSTFHCLDFGVPCAAPGTSPEEIAAAKKAANDRALAANEAAAAQGDPYGLLRMGERYRDGDDVETNLDLARSYLSRAMAAGDMTASNELAVLPVGDPTAKP